MGFERNVIELNDNESTIVKKYIQLYKDYRDLLHSSKQYYLDTDKSAIAQVFVAEDKAQALLMFYQNAMPQNMLPQKLKIIGLDSNKTYTLRMLNDIDNIGYVMKSSPLICEQTINLTGNILSNIGLDIPLLHPQSAILINIREINYEI